MGRRVYTARHRSKEDPIDPIDPPVSQATRRLLAALDGDRRALAELAGLPAAAVRGHRLLPALARRARDAGLAIGDAWQRAWRQNAAHGMLLEAELRRAGTALGQAGIAWMPIKGCDLAARFYPAAEDRPSSDVDLLIAGRDLPSARAALGAAGWHGLPQGRAAERYLAEEGYAWQAVRPGGTLLEVHFRLWGLAPASLGEALLASASAAAELPAGGRRPSAAAAYLLAACHQWLVAPPRPLLGWWDLEQIATVEAGDGGDDGDEDDDGDDDLAADVAALARRFDLQLPVALAAAQAAALWPRDAHRAIVERLAGELRISERAIARRLGRRGADAVSLRAVVLARLVAGRRSRAGWRTVPRQLWAHPGVVAQETPAAWSWPRRRLVHLARQLLPARQEG